MRGMDTKDRIMYVAMDLISAKGFRAVTIKEVAAGAGVSEMTVFRKFTSKKNMLMEAFDRFSVSFPFQEVFHDQLTGNPDIDLMNICKAISYRNGCHRLGSPIRNVSFSRTTGAWPFLTLPTIR